MKITITRYQAIKVPWVHAQRIGLLLLLIFFGQSNVMAQSTAAKDSKTGYASIGDLVWIDANGNGIQDKGEVGVPNVMVTLYDSMLNTIATKYTDADGHYRFDSIAVPVSGEKAFIAGFNNVPPDYAYTNLVQDSNFRSLNSKSDPITGRTPLFHLHAGSIVTDIDAGIKSAPGVVLPLTLDQFNGSYSNGVIHLKWTTFTAVNMDHFDVERSTDGVNFRQIGSISALGSNSESYSFMDLTADRGSSFYRLTMVDNEGNYTYSKAITVSVDFKGISVSVVYPNPFSKRVQVKIDADKPEQVTIKVLDNSGGVVRTQLANVFPGENNIVIQNVAELPGGVYFLEVTGEHRSMKTKLMKQ
jgi:hypothetical protein